MKWEICVRDVSRSLRGRTRAWARIRADAGGAGREGRDQRPRQPPQRAREPTFYGSGGGRGDQASGGEAIADGNDVSDWAGAKALIDKRSDTFGRLDVLINNAGILRDRMMVNMTEQEWDSVIKVI